MSPNSIYIKALHRSKLLYPSHCPWQTKHRQRPTGLMMMRRFSHCTSFSALKQRFLWTGLSRVVHKGHWIKRFMEQSTSYQSSFEQTTIGHMYKDKQTVRITLRCSLSSLGERITVASLFPTEANLVRSISTYCSLEVFVFWGSSKTAHVTLHHTIASNQDPNLKTYSIL